MFTKAKKTSLSLELNSSVSFVCLDWLRECIAAVDMFHKFSSQLLFAIFN